MGFGKDGLGVIQKYQDSITLGALAGGTAVKSNTVLAITDDFRLIKATLVNFIEGLTAGEGKGLILGICNADLTAAQIEAAMEAAGPLNRNDRDKAEAAMRFAKVLACAGALGPAASDTEGQFLNEHGGPIIDAVVRWTFSKSIGYAFFVYNYDNSALTTGATVRLHVTAYGVWVG